ncbi:MAG: TVP38/TMEM64 family protein [Candidatus Poseidoniaceae archaeon]|nr:TVP38/TMEM64 family protein [Candidatus Poseidoniaceae archaeon]
MSSSAKTSRIKIKQGKAGRIRLFISLGVVFLWLILGYYAFKDVGDFIDWVEDLGPLAPIFYAILVSLAVVLLFPTPILKVASGAIFPYWIAVVVNFFASVIGGLLAFLLGRWLFRERIEELVAKDERLKNLELAINEEAMQISVLVRLSPIIPDEWLNYIMASSPVTTRVFFISNLSSVIYSLAYAYFGHAAGKIVLSGGGMDGFKDSPSGSILLIIGIIASILATIVVARVTMKTLESKVDVN